ncbi:NADH dehydrogenase [Scopulibacillus daqui]|uniref:NADH dehydrogenase n=1 Tax=Scopulibacillus daqui TaxID=1469162 RepID=A0ABS2Q1B0_9BACL|nr:NAD(P)/FAD-dependent oxidoreductase [Scopulibacillus daqui]MBM7646083.1 NADH dehydrogenase [Scopulibacillus daqui]
MERLVLVGGGYGNVRVMNHLFSDGLPNDVEVTLIDREPYHCMKTEYYALAAGTISDQDVRVSFPKHPQLKIINAEVIKINLADKKIHLKNAEDVSYDTVVIGLGCEDKYHGVPGAPEYTLSIQSIRNVRYTAQKLHSMPSGSTVSIVGAGLSGIEVASELCESRKDLNIRLYDRGERILSTFPERVSHYIQEWFENNGVTVINNSNITKVEPDCLYNNDEPNHTDVVIWTAGIQAHHLVQELDIEKGSGGRAIVTEHHYLPDHPEVFVVGDCAYYDQAPSAQLSEAQGDQIYKVLKARWNNQPEPKLEEIKLKGMVGSLGKKKGFAEFMGKPLTGRVARLLKSGILWMYRHHNG